MTYFFDEINNVIIRSDLIRYDENKNLIFSQENEFLIQDKYNLTSSKIYLIEVFRKFIVMKKLK